VGLVGVRQVLNAASAKLSPVRLTYSLMRCKMMTLNSKSGVAGLGAPSFRPNNLVLPFPDDAPPAAGAATLWVHAHIQNHRLHVADARGSPQGRPRGGIFDTDSGEPYYAELLRARDPEELHKIQTRYWPHLGAIRVRAGVSGEALDWLFLKGTPRLVAVAQLARPTRSDCLHAKTCRAAGLRACAQS
jgi:hypothetical protein